MTRLIRLGRIALQIGLLTLIFGLGSLITRRLGWPVPGSVAGLAILLALLASGIVKLAWLEEGANWLLSNMLLFFIPTAVGMIQYGDLMAESGVAIVGLIAMSTVLVMAVTGLAADTLSRFRQRGGEQR